MDHSYEEIRKVAIEILTKREKCTEYPTQYVGLEISIAEVFHRRGHVMLRSPSDGSTPNLSHQESEIYREVFWDLFRQGIITLGSNRANLNFPFFSLSSFGKKIIENQEPYFFHDVSSYEKVVKENIPDVDPVTLIYLKEAMQAFLSGCVLSSSVMLGVSIEHSFFKVLEAIEQNPKYKTLFKNVFELKTALQKLNKFTHILEQNQSILTPEVKEGLDTNFTQITSMIRNFRNESGHPSGKRISREQCYVLLYLFIPCCKKIYQLINLFK